MNIYAQNLAKRFRRVPLCTVERLLLLETLMLILHKDLTSYRVTLLPTKIWKQLSAVQSKIRLRVRLAFRQLRKDGEAD